MVNEAIFTMDTSSIKYGAGSTAEVGSDAADRGLKRIAVFSDHGVANTVAYDVTMDSLKKAGLDVHTFLDVRVEPTDTSWAEASRWATELQPDGYVAVGGGSVIDTAKAANLYASYPAPLLTYVNAPIGEAKPVPGSVKPLIAIPTTAGTGSETTGVAVFDFSSMHAKTAIASRALRPTVGIVDPMNTLSMPAMVTASSALDVLSHAIESYTALPYSHRPAPESPKMRPSYQGSNPISDIWSTKAMAMVAEALPVVLSDPNNVEARGRMMLAATYAGIGFGNAGVHLPHGMSYPIAGMVKDWRPAGYDVDHAIVPHGISVILTAPSVFRWTASSDPARHLESADLLGADISQAGPEDAGNVLADRLIEIMKATNMPNGLAEIGFTEADVDGLVNGTLPQHRVTKLAPRPAGEAELRQLFIDSMRYW
jgi:hydroxyacid-oxoacid transhydrogenase